MPKPAPPPRAVAITGCDSGIGLLTASAAHAAGYHVFAGCLTDAGAQSLAKEFAGSPRMVPLKLDVTSQASVAAFGAAVAAGTPTPGRLHGVVNNAGVFRYGMVDWLSVDAYRSVLEINFLGAVAVTKALLPLLLAAGPDGRRGRVVNLSSAAGTVAGPGWSAYCASKFALEGWSDALRREVGPHGVAVSLLEPSFLRTPLAEDTARYVHAAWDAATPDARERWGVGFKDETAAKQASAADAAVDPACAVDAILHALRARSPRLRYRPNWASKTFFWLMSVLPASWVDALSAADTATKAKPRWALPAGSGGAQAKPQA